MVQERETFVQVAIGGMGIGKSFTTEKLVRAYAEAHPKRTILIFDPNFEDAWNHYPAVHFDIMEIQKARKLEKKNNTRIVTNSEKNIKNLPPGIFIIAPFTIYKEPMNQPQLLLTMTVICTTFRGGLCLLEDINKYTISFERTEIQSSFKAIRHCSTDYIIHFQSLNPIRPIIYESVRLVRMHYDGKDITGIKNKVGDYYTILRIGQLIVNDKYQTGEDIARQYPNWESNPKLKEVVNNYRRFYLYVFIKERYITGVSYKDFVKACFRYLSENKSDYQSQLAKVKQLKIKSNLSIEDEAKVLWIKENQRMFKA